MSYVHSILITGSSGVGKSTLMRGALETYGSGLAVLAPGTDEVDSYLPLNDNPNYKFAYFDDPLFSPSLGFWEATGHKALVTWLRTTYVEMKQDADKGLEPKYKVLIIDTISAVARLSYNAVLAKMRRDEPPPAKSPEGAAFYSALKIKLEEPVRVMRAIKGLGVHWIAASHPTEAEATQMQSGDEGRSKMIIMPDLPGGFKNVLPSFFTTVVHEAIGVKGGKRVHYLQWGPDPKKVTKSRLGVIGDVDNGKTMPYIVLPKGKEAWLTLSGRVEQLVAGQISTK